MSNASSEAESRQPAPVPSADASERRKGFPHPVVAGLLVLVSFFVCQLLGSLVVVFLARTTGGLADPDNPVLFGSPITLQFAFILVAEGLLLLFLTLYARSRGLTRKDFGLVRPRVSDVFWPVVAFFVYISAYMIFLQVVKLLVPGFDMDQKQDIGFDGASGLVPLSLVFFALVVLAPVTEELLLRGLMFGSLRKRHMFISSAVVTSLIFGAMHLGGGVQGEGLLWVAALDTFVLSLALCYLREKTGRLWASIGLHAIKNGIAFLALFVLVSGN